MKLPFNIDLKDKVVVVTGAGGIICSYLAKAVAMCGAKVALLDLNRDAADVYAQEIIKEGYIAKAYGCNVLDKEFGIVKGYMTTVHAYTNDQATLDVPHKKGIKARRGRACAMNIVPASTGAASAIGKVIPSLLGKLDGNAFRVPVPDGSVIDVTLELSRNTSVEEINALFTNNQSETLKITMDPVVSSDILGKKTGALVDGLSTSVLESDGKQLVKIIAWYDNEMGYTAQMMRTAKTLMNINK